MAPIARSILFPFLKSSGHAGKGPLLPPGGSAVHTTIFTFMLRVYYKHHPLIFHYNWLNIIHQKAERKCLRFYEWQEKWLDHTKALNSEAWLLSCLYISIFDLLFTQLFRRLLCGLVIVLLFREN